MSGQRARGISGEQKIGEIRARDEQDGGDGREQNVKRLAKSSADLLL